ncbi:T9SS-dependent choice-of-anchor J family protein [Aequorivita lipolytica]|uniref:T9SS type A sorting domain-containing protein n=1 Tax=Aequorivita lipolytica TaxID=153267 RepID=A0A5C6YLD4_9FLAO|nr:choice-of-anchor J domain-containing protein [Aequorivita lipolytica]TXD68004.1 T9SS type A sorting domain-containing protein [Aequorivita lipolytica]SRX52188.1 hypothetical protein AEQU2_02168 [Aequorivita lipolytica]
MKKFTLLIFAFCAFIATMEAQFIQPNSSFHGARSLGVENRQQPSVSIEQLLARLQQNQTGLDSQQFTAAERQALSAYYRAQNSANRGPAATLLTEGFDDITTLPGAGYSLVNASDIPGATNWFQGNDVVFPSQSGGPTSYIGANFNNTSGSVINNFMITPVLNLENGDEIIFWTRTTTASTFPDRLEVRLDPTGANTNPTGPASVGSYTELLLEINPTLVTGVYPDVWTEFTATVSGLTGATDTRVAFRYWVTDGGPAGSNSDYIGIDSLTIEEGTGGGGGGDPTVFAANIRASCGLDFGSFPLPGPYTLAPIAPNASSIYGGDFDENGTLYAFNGTTSTLLSLDETTGAETTIGPITGLLATETLRGMAWNDADSTMYVLAGAGEVGSVYTINLTTAVATLVGSSTITGWLPIWLAIDSNGNAFMADVGLDSLYSVDLTTGTATLVGPLGVNINFAQDADFDPDTDTLYMAAYIGGGVNLFASVDTATGVATPLGSVNADCAELGLVAIKGTSGGGGGCTPDSLTTLFAGGNGGSPGGAVYFDISVGASDIEVSSFDMNTASTAAFNMDVYVFEGTYVGNQANPALWGAAVAIGSGTGAGIGIPSTATLDAPIMMTAGTTYAVALVFDSTAAHTYTNGDGTNQNYSNGDITLDLGSASNVPFTNPIFDPRIWNGSVGYCVGGGGGPTCTSTAYDSTAVPFDIDGAGTSTADCANAPNLIPITVADIGTIGTGAILENITIDIAHTFSADLDLYLVSPNGTELLLANDLGGGTDDGYNGTMFEDGGADITLATAPFGVGPYEPVGGTFAAAFAGEDITGVWSLKVCDDAGGDSGQVLQFSMSICVPPVFTNDDCENAIALACGDSVVGETITATDSGGNASPDVFYKFTGNGSPQLVTISLCAATDFDSILRIFDDCNLANELAFNDDSCGLQSEVSFTSDGTSTYYIMVEGFGSSSGNFSLDVTCTDPLPNDECSGAIAVSCGDSVTGTTVGATVDTAPTCGTPITSPGVWYSLNDDSGLPGDITVSLCNGTNFDSKISVYSGTCSALVCVDGNDDACGLQSEVTFASNGNTQYYILIHSFGGATGNFTLDVTCTPTPPPNDMIVNSIDVDEIGFPYTDPSVAMPAATTENGNPVDCDLTGANGVWYNFVSGGDGTAIASIVTPGGASSVTFYTAPNENASETDLTLVPQQSNQCGPGTSASIFTLAGQAYYVFVLNTGAVTDITIDGTNLGVSDNTIAGFSYYPNPTNGVLNLKSVENIEQVALYNLLGQRVVYSQVGATESKVDVSGLSTGTYLMKVTVNGQIGTYKVLKQ